MMINIKRSTFAFLGALNNFPKLMQTTIACDIIIT